MSLKFRFASVSAKHTGRLHISLDSKWTVESCRICMRNGLMFSLSASLLTTYWLLKSIDCTFPQWPESRKKGYFLVQTLTPPPADLEQIELETPSVGGSATSWAPCCDTGLDLPQRKSSPKVCINTILPPCQVRPTCSTCLLPGLQLAQTEAGTLKCGPGHNSPKEGFWLIEPKDMQPIANDRY